MNFNYICVHSHYFDNIGLKIEAGKKYRIVSLNKFTTNGKKMYSNDNLYVIEYDSFCAIITYEDLREYFVSI